MKTKYLLLAGLVVVLGSCSTAYRSGQTPDDVYYSPEPAARETYVVTNNNSDGESYAYRNAEEREIRRAIRNPRYRTSISLNMGYGLGYGYNPYYSPYGFNSFYDPFYSPYYGYGKGYFSPYAYNPYFGSFGYSPYYSYYPYGSAFNPYYGGHFGNYYSPVYYPVTPRAVNPNTGPRRVNLSNYGNSNTPRVTNTRSAVTPSSPNRVPVRTFPSRSGSTIERNTNRNTQQNNRTIRRSFTPRNSDSYRTQENNNRRYTAPARERSSESRPVNTTPTRTFERSSTPPVNSAPPVNNSNNSRTPVRTFRNN